MRVMSQAEGQGTFDFSFLMPSIHQNHRPQCSGDKPSCSRCFSRGLECEYSMIDERLRGQTRRTRMSAIERSRMQRRHTGQGDIINMNGQMYVAVDGQRSRRPELVKYATEGGQVYGLEDGTDEMDVDVGALHIRRSGSGSGSGTPPQILRSQNGSEEQFHPYLPHMRSEPGYNHPQVGHESEGDETELVVVKIPKRNRRHSLLDLLNPVSIHPLAALKSGGHRGYSASEMNLHGRQHSHPVEFPSTNPTLPSGSLPVMLDPALASGTSGFSGGMPPPGTPRRSEYISVASLVSGPTKSLTSSPARSISQSSSTYASDAESSIGVGVGAAAIDDLETNMGWLETMQCVSRRADAGGQWASDEEGLEVDYDEEERRARMRRCELPFT